jgi:putative ABC transport system permease protein
MIGAFYIGWRYLVFHRIKTLLLIGCLTLVLFLPVALRILVGHTEQQLTARAEATPLLIGAKGSPLELTLNSLYFDTKVPAQLEYEETSRVRDTGLAQPIPLYVRFRSREHPIVGTSLDYFEFRGLRIAQGRQMQRLGDCVVGAAVADHLGLSAGDSIVSSPETVFDIAGIYPLKMHVTGVLEPENSPDDHAVFTDIKTTWIIEGLAHGHTDLARPDARTGVLKRDGDRITANASVVQYNEITDENVGSFHFHGDVSGFPMTAILAVPVDEKAGTLLMGRYLGESGATQILKPQKVVDKLLATILTVQQYVTVGMAVLGVATLATAALVFLLSLRLRRREIETLHKIGGQRAAVLAICAFEIVFVLAVSVAFAAMLAGATHWIGPDLMRIFL